MKQNKRSFLQQGFDTFTKPQGLKRPAAANGAVKDFKGVRYPM